MKYDIYINGSIGYPFSASFIQDELAKVGDAPTRCKSRFAYTLHMKTLDHLKSILAT